MSGDINGKNGVATISLCVIEYEMSEIFPN